MDTASPRRLILAEGFAGRPVELFEPAQVWSFSREELPSRSPFEALRQAEQALRPGEAIAGFLGYECAVAAEPSLVLPAPPIGAPAAWFATFRRVEPVSLSALPLPLHVPAPLSVDPGQAPARYAAAVQAIRERITAGDVFQVNYSHRQTAVFPRGDVPLIDRLPWREALSARFGALLDLGAFAIVSQSPELFLSLDRGVLASEPIKGTRRRSDDPVLDAELLAELMSDEKDRAENVMIVDLMRNDLARACEDGSIRESAICAARSLPAVHHLYSRIEGRLCHGLTFADALGAAFPCGSVTGAPKIAAMKAIAELEGEGRGAYCGSVFFITAGRAVASVAIRTAVIDGEAARVDVRSGGGVTVLSDPLAEHEEALSKGYLFRTLAGCG